MSKYNSFFERTFEKISGLLSSDLNKLLIKTYGINPDNARKLIERKNNANIIWSTKPLSFGNGQYYYYRPGNKPSRDEIKDLLKEHRPPVYRLLQLLDDNRGVICFYEGLKITSSPDENSKSKSSFLKDIVNDLAKLKLIVERSDESGINYILNRCDNEDDYKQLMAQHIKNMKIDTVFNADLMGWLFESNIIASYGGFRSSSSPSFGVKHNNIYWDGFAYSKTTGINPTVASESNSTQKQTLVVIDILIYREYSLNDLNGFISRIQINNNSVKEHQRKCIPVVIYSTISTHALNVAKKLGFLVFGLAKLYGSNIHRLISDIKSIHEISSDSLNEGIEIALQKIAVSGQTEKLKNLRGVLFEALMRPVLENLYPNSSIYPNKILKHPEKEMTREFDYIINSSNPKELIFVELKGYAGSSFIRLGDSATPNTLRYFLRGSLPLAKCYYKDDLILESHAIKVLFITTGGYHSECKDFIASTERSNQVPSRMGSSIFNGIALIELLKKNNFDHEILIINKYYIKVQDED